MDRYKLLITGGAPLRGETTVFGGKNTSVAVVPAMLLCDEPCVVENLPDIEDIHVVYDMLNLLGAKVDYEPKARRMTVDPRPVNSFHVPYQYTQRMRASYYLWGALLGRCGQCEVGYPGGCAIGNRPFEQHVKGFRALGAQVDDYGGMIYAKGDMVGADVFFDRITVGGTINVMLAAAKAHGNTTIHNAAREPHIVDLANFLNSMGGRVRGAGTDTIRVRAERQHRAVNIKTQEYPGFPTDLQQPMSAMLTCAAGDSLVIETIFENRFKHLVEMQRMGAKVRIVEQTAIIEGVDALYGAPVTATDLRAGAALVIAGLMAKGTTEIYEPSYIERGYERIEDKLRALGADIARVPL